MFETSVEHKDKLRRVNFHQIQHKDKAKGKKDKNTPPCCFLQIRRQKFLKNANLEVNINKHNEICLHSKQSTVFY